MRYSAGFDVSQLTTGTLTVDPANGTAVVITMSDLTGNDRNSETSSLFFHNDTLISDLWLPDYSLGAAFGPDGTRLAKWVETPYADALEMAIQAAAILAGDWTAGAANFNVTIDSDTLAYTFAYAENFSLTWSSGNGRYFLGFGANQSGASSYSSSAAPFFTIAPSVPVAVEPTTIYEPEGVASLAIADNGSGFGIARTTAPLMLSWTQSFESKEKTLAQGAYPTGTELFTHQHLRAHCRTVYPFAVYDGFGDSFTSVFCRLTPESSHLNWRDIRATPGNDSQFHVPYEVYVEGWAL